MSEKETTFLFFDTEAIGFPRKWNAPASDTFNWPRMTQLAWIVFDNKKKPLHSAHYLIQPEGFEIPVEAEEAQGITTKMAKEEGAPLEQALNEFNAAIRDATYVVSHNMAFNENIVGAEFVRKAINHPLHNSERYCTMRESTHFCKLPGKRGGYKWPTLNELYFKLYGKRYKASNNALVDAKVCAVCFFRLVDIEAIDLF